VTGAAKNLGRRRGSEWVRISVIVGSDSGTIVGRHSG
jgi:hypothetical protein